MIKNWQKEILDASINSRTLAIALFDISGNLKYCNLAMSQLCRGKPNGNFINPTLEKMLEITSKNPFRGVITFADESANNYSIEGKVIRKDEELFIVGEVNVAQLVKQNVSMTLLNQQINNLQRQLIKEKKMLQKANQDLANLNEEKNNVMGIAAHDLRSPMSSSYAFADLILEDFDELKADEIKKYLKIIAENSKDSLDLLNELLDISAIESGKIKLKIEQNNFSSLLKNTIETFRILAAKKQIELKLNQKNLEIIFYFDRLRIKQVIENLISNAVKYAPPNTTIDIKTTIKDGYVRTDISDQGQGIPYEEIDSLFQPFHTSNINPTGNEKSTGLGLSIVKKILTLHNGKIEVESTVGKGSTFTFCLPLIIDSKH
jgi:signal transduction histidine kinase